MKSKKRNKKALPEALSLMFAFVSKEAAKSASTADKASPPPLPLPPLVLAGGTMAVVEFAAASRKKLKKVFCFHYYQKCIKLIIIHFNLPLMASIFFAASAFLASCRVRLAA